MIEFFAGKRSAQYVMTGKQNWACWLILKAVWILRRNISLSKLFVWIAFISMHQVTTKALVNFGIQEYIKTNAEKNIKAQCYYKRYSFFYAVFFQIYGKKMNSRFILRKILFYQIVTVLFLFYYFSILTLFSLRLLRIWIVKKIVLLHSVTRQTSLVSTYPKMITLRS